MGDVVIVRWWTGPHCQLCIASSSVLNEFHNEFGESGLKVVGFYHHKSHDPVNKEKIKLNVQSLGFQFPVAIDHKWQTLQSWWLNGGSRRFTSVTFLLDRNGVVRHVHPGGEYIKGDDAYKKIRGMIKILLGEKI